MANTASLSPCLIIGAGIAGLTAARMLQRQGVTATVLDKARGVGGRMATRRVSITQPANGFASFDHGAQFFTARSPEFQDTVAKWQEAGVAGEWFRGQLGNATPSKDDHPRFRGAGGMTSIPKYLSEGVQVGLNEFVIHIRYDSDRWIAMTAGGSEFAGAALILTAPVPQSLALLRSGGVDLQRSDCQVLEAVTYDPCICVMALLDGASHIPAPGAIRLHNGPVVWLADNYQKGVSANPGAVTIHAAPQWSRDHYNENDETLATTLCESVQEWLGAPVVSTQIRRWRYSKAVGTHPAAFLRAEHPLPIVFAGDAFSANGIANVESAMLSGLAAARAIA